MGYDHLIYERDSEGYKPKSPRDENDSVPTAEKTLLERAARSRRYSLQFRKEFEQAVQHASRAGVSNARIATAVGLSESGIRMLVQRLAK